MINPIILYSQISTQDHLLVSNFPPPSVPEDLFSFPGSSFFLFVLQWGFMQSSRALCSLYMQEWPLTSDPPVWGS